jgi:gamma-glutamyl-gamma-aminobutyrate hydrolase PuuD/DNA-directed RNA polymerase specialized sigma24 family protein
MAPPRSLAPSSSFEALLVAQAPAVTRRLRALVGDHETAEDLCQEALSRAWRVPALQGDPERLRAWLLRTARNLAIDELRRRGRRDHVALTDDLPGAPTGGDAPAREALAALTPHQRLVLLLRFEAGLSLRELGDALAISEEAARKRVARARAAFVAAHGELTASDRRPTVAVVLGRDNGDAYRTWLEAGGARVRMLVRERPGIDLVGVDAIVLTGSVTDVHPGLYGQRPGTHLRETDRYRDERDLAILRAALRADVPILGVCRGTQLLNILAGGDLVQHLDAAGPFANHGEPHPVETAAGSLVRGTLGARGSVCSIHHQAVGRLGRGLRVAARAPDGLIEALEVPGRRFALGVQWHPERDSGPASTRLADALVEAAA